MAPGLAGADAVESGVPRGAGRRRLRARQGGWVGGCSGLEVPSAASEGRTGTKGSEERGGPGPGGRRAGDVADPGARARGARRRRRRSGKRLAGVTVLIPGHVCERPAGSPGPFPTQSPRAPARDSRAPGASPWLFSRGSPRPCSLGPGQEVWWRPR